MAEKVIGLDVGTNAVRGVEVALGAHPRLLRFGQVALPPDAVVEGEVSDVAAVADALRRLWNEVGFRNKSVRVGIASARVILRIVEMPELSEDDTRSALGLQLGDYVPMAPESTVFGFQPIARPDGWGGGPPQAGTEGSGPADADDAPGTPDGAGDQGSEGLDRQQRLLLAAAHQDAVSPLVEAVRQAGLKATAVDVIPAALARSLAPPETDGVGPPPVEAIVSLGAGTTLVVVTRGGTPLFSRTVTSVAGRQCTERLADQLTVARIEAERAKRRAATVDRLAPPAGDGGLGNRAAYNGVAAPDGPTPALGTVAAAAAARALTAPSGPGDMAEAMADAQAVAAREALGPLVAELVAEVTDSLDYYGSQPGALPVDRVVLTGGGMRLAGAGDLLSERLGLPVTDADPFARLEGVPAGFEPVDLPFLAPYLPAAVGLALGGGRSRVSRINLLPEQRRRPGGSRLPLVAAAAAVLVLLLAGSLYWQRRGDIAREEQATAAARQELNQLLAAATAPTASGPAAGADAASVVRAALVTDPDWLAAARRLDEIHADLGIEVGNVQGTMTAPAVAKGPQAAGATTTTTASPPTTAAGSTGPARSGGAAGAAVDPTTGAVLGVSLGSLTITATALDLDAVAAWLDAVEADPRFADPVVSAITPQGGAAGVAGAGGVQFTAELKLTGENLVPRILREPPR